MSFVLVSVSRLKGGSMIGAVERMGRFVHFAARALPASAAALLEPREWSRQLYVVLVGALPLGLVTGLALGIVVWMHLHGVVSAEYAVHVPKYLAMAVVLEFGPLGAGLVVAGRTGASLGAELGSMKVTEQIDALEAMGLSPWRHLIGPRVLACLVSLPILTVYIGAVAIGGSFLAEMLGGTLSATQYRLEVMRGLAEAQPVPSTLKTVVFGYLIGVAGCHIGMNAAGGTEGVGQAATRSVVASILLVLIANVVLVKVIQMTT